LSARTEELRSRIVEVCQQGVIDGVATEEIERFFFSPPKRFVVNAPPPNNPVALDDT
jgi:hypothetical protein